MGDGAQPTVEVTIIEPPRAGIDLGLGACWRYRELFAVLVWRELAVRYKQTAIGVAWAALQPLATMAVFTIFLGRLARVPSEGLPYAPFVLVGLLPWTLVSRGLGEAATTLLANERLVGKVYFPRLLLPAAVVAAAAVDAAIALVLALGAVLIAGLPLTASALAAPLVLVAAGALAMGLGWGLAAIDVRYRDVRYALPFLTQLWFFASPIAYPASLIAPEWRWVYGLNPVCGLVECMRWSLLGLPPDPGVVTTSALAIVTIVITGLVVFRSGESDLVDRL